MATKKENDKDPKGKDAKGKDVKEVKEGFECGLNLKGFDDIQEGDQLEIYEIQEVARSL